MIVYTIQTIDFYNQLLQEGIAYCDRESDFCQDYRFQYDWMAEQMRNRIGEPPIKDIKYPIWVWKQYNSKKNPKPPMSPREIRENQDEAVMLELEVPDNQVLLSTLDLWILPLSNWAICNRNEDRLLQKEIEDYEKNHGECYKMLEYPEEIRNKILNTWERIFDLNICDPYIILPKPHNRSIQGTMWILRKEWLKVAHIFNRHSELKRCYF